jgi:hypothetical protein
MFFKYSILLKCSVSHIFEKPHSLNICFTSNIQLNCILWFSFNLRHSLCNIFSNNAILEKIHLRFCKILLNLKTSTPSYMLYGDLGRCPVYIDIKIRTVCYWARLIVVSKQSILIYCIDYVINWMQIIIRRWCFQI